LFWPNQNFSLNPSLLISYCMWSIRNWEKFSSFQSWRWLQTYSFLEDHHPSPQSITPLPTYFGFNFLFSFSLSFKGFPLSTPLFRHIFLFLFWFFPFSKILLNPILYFSLNHNINLSNFIIFLISIFPPPWHSSALILNLILI